VALPTIRLKKLLKPLKLYYQPIKPYYCNKLYLKTNEKTLSILKPFGAST